LETAKVYREKNKSLRASHQTQRRAKHKQANPKWVNDDGMFLIHETYHLSNLRTKVTGIKWEVDHIIPLQNELVCGLHVIENLRVIPKSINASKGNRYTIS
jgi:5-methylcytosine-specific restriction endonuclease McrA